MSMQWLAVPEMGSYFRSDEYELLGKIGQGGFGHVYKARRLNTDQIVAIKFLIQNPEFNANKKRRYIQRFERETQLCSRLQHPNIVRLIDKGRCDDLLYAVFEYVDGQSLKEVLAESGALLPVDTAEMMSQVLDALAHAHEQGVIHRDIKPANIMLTKVGAKTYAKVLDFGIGTLVNEARHLDHKTITLTQEILGTPSYSAPEQLRGEPPTCKSDLYVWGLVFIECLTGRPAITGSNLASIFHKQLSPTNVPLPTAVAGHPIAALLRRVLHKNTHERTGHAAEVYNALSQINFSALVGEINVNQTIETSTNNIMEMHVDNDKTQINGDRFLYTGQAERKQITAMCICVSVRSATDKDIDHEVTDALHLDQKAQCVDTAIRYGGFHVGTLGGTLLFYFGYPVVSDNDSRLCARTALDIISSLHKRNSLLEQSQGVVAEVQIGIHSGIVTSYADMIPEGETPHISMELARHALPNQVLCSDNSKKILNTYIEFEPNGERSIGMSTKEIPLYLLTGERKVEAFGFLRSKRINHDFIGREEELSALVNSLGHDDSSNEKRIPPKTTHVYGEAGIGKSRLVFELRKRARNFTHYVAQCLPEHKNNALYPVLNVLRYKYSLDAITTAVAVKKLRTKISTLNEIDEKQAIPVLCSWLALPLPGDISPTFHTPNSQKQILFDVLVALLTLQESNKNDEPSLYIFEDTHWADPTSIEFIARLTACETLHKGGHAFISTSRNALPAALVNSNFRTIELRKLSQKKTAELIVTLFDKQKLSPNMLNVVVARTDGIPLFIEELINMLKQQGLVHRLNGLVDFVNPGKIDEIPNSLRESLQQKLDSLVYAKETAQLAAAIGREFNYELLTSASNRSEEQVQTDLNELLETELIYIQRKVEGSRYIFTHALVRDAAYESMVLEAKKAVHNAVAGILERQQNIASGHELPLIAHHHSEAGNSESAYRYWFQAGQYITKVGANDEALHHFEKALESLHVQKLSNLEPELAKQLTQNEIELQCALAVCNIELKGYANDIVKEHYSQARELFKKINTSADMIPILWGIGCYFMVRGEFLEATSTAEELFDVVKLIHDPVTKIDFFAQKHLVAGVFLWQGKIRESIDIYESNIANYNFDLHSEVVARYSYDLGIAEMSYCALGYAHMGNTVKARKLSQKALSYAKKSQHLYTLTHALCRGAKISIFLKDYDTAELQIENALSLSEENDFSLWNSVAKIISGWLKCQFKPPSYQEGIQQIKTGIESYRDSGAVANLSWYLALNAEALALNEYNLSKSRKFIEESIQMAESSGDIFFLENAKKIRSTIYEMS